MTNSRNILTIVLFALLAIATAPIFAHAEIAGKVESKGDAKVVIVSEPQWQTETTYWSENYTSRPYYNKTITYTTIEPAYKYGYTIYPEFGGVPFDQIEEAKLRAAWEDAYDHSVITWNEAYPAIRDSYTRVYEYHHVPATSPAAGAPVVTTKKTVVIESEE